MLAVSDAKINEVAVYTQSTSEDVVTLERWSDDHLDRALAFKAVLDIIINGINTIVEDIIDISNGIALGTSKAAVEELLALLPRLKEFHNDCDKSVAKFQRTSFAEAIQSAINTYKMEIDHLKEAIQDIETAHVAAKSNEKLRSILSRL
ncbi:hypothetical protein [Fibrivirga algicola]|uniref:DUF2383 domain-containing protein n=1 Tax=Fibrivirga algicola TaxID=2950420 RepID=A0ABX0QAT0_9BACT|nr:hypothetical protein [Fibrivirga algicola]NID09384.1 hypothetical protein [Fibrivirga algicola]